MAFAAIFWIIIVLLSVGVEIHTQAFVSIFVGLGAAIAFVLALASVPFPIEALVWAPVSIFGVLAIRPLAIRRFPHRPYEIDMSQPTYSAMTHMTGFVEIAVGDEKNPGRVKIQGETWKAVTDWPEALAIGQQITVDKAYGTTLWVRPV